MGRRAIVRLSICAVIFATLGTLLLFNGAILWGNEYISSTVVGMVLMGMSMLCLDIILLSPADSHSTSSLLLQYLGHRWISLLAGLLTSTYVKNTFKDSKRYQENTLKWILEENRETAYAQDHNLPSIKTREEFVTQRPLTTFKDYEKYVDRIAKGEKLVMTKADVIYFGLSSGTTGKSKMCPFTLGGARRGGPVFIYTKYCMRDLFRNVGLQRNFLFRVVHPRRTSECGIPIGGLTQWYSIPPFVSNLIPKDYLNIEKEEPIFYVQAIFALAERELGCIDGFSSDLMYVFFNFIVLHKEEICEAIETGTVCPYPDLDEGIRMVLSQHLRADPARAQQVRKILDGPKEGMGLRLWPGLAHCIVASSGGFASSNQLLSGTYLKDVPMAFTIHSASEGFFGASQDPSCPDQYTMVTNLQFLEFIPADHIHDEQPQTLFMEQLEVGKQYEMVITTIGGLYRYRFGDVIEVTGFHDDTPKYRFIYRSGQILNVAFERTPETVFYQALRAAVDTWCGVILLNYTAVESIHLEQITGEVVSPGCYFLFLEVTSDGEDEHIELTSEQENDIEKSLCSAHELYAGFRAKGALGPIRLIQVRAGSFDAVRAAILGGHPSSQFKMPRVQRRPDILQVLWDRRLTPRV